MPHVAALPPKIAIILPNTLAGMGLRHLLATMMPGAEIHLYNGVDEARAAGESFYHYFISSETLLHAVDYFNARSRKTFVLVQGPNEHVPAHFRTLNVAQDEEGITKTFLRLEEAGHGASAPHADAVRPIRAAQGSLLTPRETDVLRLLVSGCINKEIANQLHVSLNTIITHRKNLTEKLNTRSVSALTIYAVMHGIVRLEDI